MTIIFRIVIENLRIFERWIQEMDDNSVTYSIFLIRVSRFARRKLLEMRDRWKNRECDWRLRAKERTFVCA